MCLRKASVRVPATPDVRWSLQRVSARMRPGLRRRNRHRHMLGGPARLEYAGWFGARTGVSAGRWRSAEGVGGAKEAGGGGLLVVTTGGTGGGGRRLWVFGAGDRRRSGLGGCPGVGGWAEGRRAKGLVGLAGSGGRERMLLVVRCYCKLAGHWGRGRGRGQTLSGCLHMRTRLGGIMPPREQPTA